MSKRRAHFEIVNLDSSPVPRPHVSRYLICSPGFSLISACPGILSMTPLHPPCRRYHRARDKPQSLVLARRKVEFLCRSYPGDATATFMYIPDSLRGWLGSFSVQTCTLQQTSIFFCSSHPIPENSVCTSRELARRIFACVLAACESTLAVVHMSLCGHSQWLISYLVCSLP